MAMINVSSPEEICKAVGNAMQGDEIVVKDGHYSDWRVQVSCDKPVEIRPEHPNGATFSGETSFQITGRDVVMRGLAFLDCRLTSSVVSLHGAVNCRVTACRFEGASGKAPVVGISGKAADNRVDHCKFIRPEARSIQVIINETSAPVRSRIDHNLFQDVPPIGGNGRETIQIGQSQPKWGRLEPLTVVEHNEFLRCDGEAEVISNKSSRNTYRYNLFVDCKGELVIRGASYCLVAGNRFEHCSGGIRLSGTHHRVVDNVIAGSRGTGIRLQYGMTVELGGLYQAVGHCLIANNTVVDAGRAGILVGDGRDKDWGEKGIANQAPYDNRFVNNVIVGKTGTLLAVNGAPENRIERNLFHATDEAAVPEAGDQPLFADPLFLDPDTGDYRLRPESPALGAGLALASDGQAADIGASAGAVLAGPSVWPAD